jgi:hypothetical protein
MAGFRFSYLYINGFNRDSDFLVLKKIMFRAKQKKLDKSPISSDIEQDFIVHNMPLPHLRLRKASAPSTKGSALESAGLVPVSPKHNFRAVGLLIILAGLLVVAVFIYLSYRFIIKPTANPIQPSEPINQEMNAADETPERGESASSSPVDLNSDLMAVATSSEVATITPEIIDIIPSDEPFNEESSGRDGRDLEPITDLDQDGLSDEEEAVFGTLTTVVDSDNDSYDDLSEIQKGYNPAGEGSLINSPSLSKYINSAYQYELIVPQSWPAQSLNSEATVIFAAPDDSLFQISVQDNSDQSSILSWYSQSFPDSVVTYNRLKNTDYYDGVIGEGGLNFYLTDKNRRYIIVISYIPAVNNRLAYPNVFQLMSDSLIIK